MGLSPLTGRSQLKMIKMVQAAAKVLHPERLIIENTTGRLETGIGTTTVETEIVTIEDLQSQASADPKVALDPTVLVIGTIGIGIIALIIETEGTMTIDPVPDKAEIAREIETAVDIMEALEVGTIGIEKDLRIGKRNHPSM